MENMSCNVHDRLLVCMEVQGAELGDWLVALVTDKEVDVAFFKLVCGI